jgi:hypothetical protein
MKLLGICEFRKIRHREGRALLAVANNVPLLLYRNNIRRYDR